MHSSPIQMLFNNLVITHCDLVVYSRTCGMKFKDFEAPVLLSSTCTFKFLNLGKKIKGLSWEPCNLYEMVQMNIEQSLKVHCLNTQ